MTHTFAMPGTYSYYAATMPQWQGVIMVRSQIPPDPATVAPPVDPSVATNLAAATAFLYSGADPIQWDVAAGVIDPARVATARGRVLDRAGAPLPGVRVAVLGQPAYGYTLSRADGYFDLAVNGGGLLTLTYEKDGYLPVQRAITAPWQEFVHAPDVVMILPDPNVTAIHLGDGAPVQVARGGVSSDADGVRQATLIFPAGVQGEMTLTNGSTQPLPATIHVRATEYTVGSLGSAAMPGDLPPASQYTYATEFSVDEAMQTGASSVHFSPTLVSYNENFLGFPVGAAVPSGYYDKGQGIWLPGKNGRVVKILSVGGGLAELDIDGSNTAATPEALALLGIDAAERQQLASLYNPGATLWRTPIAHFSPWDFNWGWGPPTDARPPRSDPPRGDGPPPDVCTEEGSIIQCQTQTLGETVEVVGAPFALH